MSDKNNSLELYIVENLKEIDPNTRVTKGSGCGNSVGDIENKYFFVESKIKHTKENIVIDYKNEWLALNNRIPLNSKKIAIIVTENKYGDKFVTMEASDFFQLIEKSYK